MCLINAELKIAEKDIICYKVYVSINGNLLSPYRREKAPEKGIIATTYLGTIIPLIGNYNTPNMVREGFHSFANVSDAINAASIWEDDTVIVKCTIPKLSRYYEGVFGGRISYCSECIILNEIITNKKCITSDVL